MAETIREHKELIFGVGTGLILAAMAIVALSGLMAPARDVSAAAAASTTITLTATVQEYLTITASENSTSMTGDLVDTAGNTGVASTGAIELYVSTNNAGGYSLTVQGLNGGLATSSYALYIQSATWVTGTPTTTIAAGTDGFGINASSTQSTITFDFDYWDSQIVAGVSSTTATTVATYASPIQNSTTSIRAYGASDALQGAGVYQEELWMTATGQT